MKTSVKVGGYTLGLAAILAASIGVGRAVGPDGRPTPAEHGGGHATDHGGTAGGALAMPGGLQVADGGYRLTPISTSLSMGGAAPLTFRITGPDGGAVIDYTPTHDKDLHLIVVRRDLSGFQHLHPHMAGDGTWSVPLGVAVAGQYRIFADFQPAARAEPLTLGVDLPAAGMYEPQGRPHCGGAGHHLLRAGALDGRLPAVFGLPARRHGPHRRVHRRRRRRPEPRDARPGGVGSRPAGRARHRPHA